MKYFKYINLTYLSIILITLFSFSNVTAQDYEVTEGSIWYNGNLKPSMNIVVNYDESKVLADKWDTFMQTKKGMDLDKEYSRLGKILLVSDWTSLRDIATEPLQFHTQFIKHANNTEMNVFVDFGNGYFMNPYMHEQEYESTRLLVSEFMNYFREDEISASRSK